MSTTEKPKPPFSSLAVSWLLVLYVSISVPPVAWSQTR
jgi:hypothetical protein